MKSGTKEKYTLIMGFFIILVCCICLFCNKASFNKPESEEYDFRKPVVLIAPVDNVRVSEIIPLLPEVPEGFGDPVVNRNVWNKLKVSGEYNKMIQDANQILIKGFPEWDEEGYMGFFTRGDSQTGKDMNTQRVRILVILTWAECIENRGKFLPAIEEWLRQLISQKTWVHPRNYDERNYNGLVELSTASYAQNIAQTLYLLGEYLSPEIKKEAIDTLYQRAFNPLLRTIEKK